MERNYLALYLAIVKGVTVSRLLIAMGISEQGGNNIKKAGDSNV